MGAWTSILESAPAPAPAPTEARFFHSRSSVSPDEILAELLEIEQQCCPSSSAALAWPKEPNVTEAAEKDRDGGEGRAPALAETLSVKVLLDEPDIRFCICYDEESPVFIACLWARLKGFDIQEVERSLCQERGEWDKGGESRLLQQITLEDGRREEVYHTLIRCPRPFWDRDVLKHQWRLPLDCQHGQGYALVSRSLEDEQLQPDSERVRAFVHKAGALIRPAREVPPRAELPEDESDSEPIANASIGTELTSCSQIDMGGLIPAWATSYLSSVVAGKALSWTEDLRQHCAERHRTDTCKEDVPSLAEISEFLMPGWTDHWDDTELVEEEFDKELSQGSMGSLLHFFSGESPRKSRSRSPI